jgi:predicted nucleic acid-binding protein
LLDSNVIDELLARPDLRRRIQERVAAHELEVFVTHLQWDEVAATPDPARRADLLTALRTIGASEVQTDGFVLRVSRLDMARLTSNEDAERHGAYVGRSARRSRDALLLATAERAGLVFVTQESKPRNLARMRAHFPGVEIISVDDV